jgi:hypothetical protein
MGQYARKCPLKEKGKGAKYVATRTLVGTGEDPSQLETSFSITSFFSYNIVSSVGWCGQWNFKKYDI